MPWIDLLSILVSSFWLINDCCVASIPTFRTVVLTLESLMFLLKFCPCWLYRSEWARELIFLKCFHVLLIKLFFLGHLIGSILLSVYAIIFSPFFPLKATIKLLLQGLLTLDQDHKCTLNKTWQQEFLLSNSDGTKIMNYLL